MFEPSSLTLLCYTIPYQGLVTCNYTASTTSLYNQCGGQIYARSMLCPGKRTAQHNLMGCLATWSKNKWSVPVVAPSIWNRWYITLHELWSFNFVTSWNVFLISEESFRAIINFISWSIKQCWKFAYLIRLFERSLRRIASKILGLICWL